MSQKEKEFTILAVIVGIVIVLWYWYEKRQAANAATAPAPNQDFTNWPMETEQNYSPPMIPNINIANQTPNLLTNQYIPLFGFVGMAQGTQW
ncbi:MAG: hypothetical protein ACRD22_00535 [Terriglobia bacterium]